MIDAVALPIAAMLASVSGIIGTGKVPDRRLELAVREVFDLTPKGIIKALALKKPIYGPTAAYGHFGRKPQVRRLANGRKAELFTWEQTDRVKDLLTAVK